MSKKKNMRYQKYNPIPDEHGDTEGFNEINASIQQQRSEVSKTQDDVMQRWEKLDVKSKTMFGTMLMRDGDKKLVTKFDEARHAAADIILKSRIESLSVVAETMVRYNKSLANALVMTLETSNAVALDSHFMESKLTLMDKLETLNDRFITLIREKEQEIMQSSGILKEMLMDQGKTLMSTWMDDYENILHDFEEIRKRQFK